MNQQQQQIGCEFIRIEVNGHQLTIQCSAGREKEQCDHIIAAHNGKLQRLSKAFVRTVCEIKHLVGASSGIFAGVFHYKHP